MGSPHSYVDEYNWTYEMPAHEVTIGRAYYMGVTEVTVEQFRLFAEQTGYITDAEKQGWVYSPDRHGLAFRASHRLAVSRLRADRPRTRRVPRLVRCVGVLPVAGRKDRSQYPPAQRSRVGIRLPAGTTGEYAGNLDAMAWYAWNSVARTHPVGQKRPNAWGLYDMHGNAWEWVQDLYHRDCTDAPTDGSAWLDTADVDPRGITRGGSFYNPEWLCRSYIRMQTSLGYKVHVNNGFRLVCDVPETRNRTAED